MKVWIHHFIIIALLLYHTLALQTMLIEQTTCFSFISEAKQEQREIYYNYGVGRHRIDVVVIEISTGKVLNSSRNISERNHYLLVTLESMGEHKLCFEKESP
jgi:hypothetical protein